MGAPRFGILTGGGDCPGLNAVLRSVVRAACSAGAAIVGIEDGFEGLIKNHDTPLGRERVRGILPRGGTILGSSNRADPFRYVSAPGGAPRDVSKRVLRRIEALRLDGLFVVGGDGTLALAHRFAMMGVPVLGIPKTIDNDIAATELSFGFDTAVGTAMWALDKLHTTAESHDRVMILEVMGRSAGWIALHGGLAGGAHAILVPEIPYEARVVARVVRERARAGKKFSIVVVAEGAVPRRGAAAITGHDVHGHPRYGGSGEVLRRKLARVLDHEVRVTVLGHLQRGGSPSAADRILGSRYGAAAVRLALSGEFGKVVALRAGAIVAAPLLAAPPRLVEPAADTCQTARALGITFGDA